VLPTGLPVELPDELDDGAGVLVAMGFVATVSFWQANRIAAEKRSVPEKNDRSIIVFPLGPAR